MPNTASFDLLNQLRQLLGDAHVLTEGDLSAYEQDWRKRTRGKALAVVRPTNTQQVADVVKACAQAGVSIVPQGGNTGLVVGSIPDDTGTQVLLSLQRMHAVRAIDADNLTITVEAGHAELMQLLLALVERLHCVPNRLPAGMRGRYHAAAGYTSQFINALFDQAVRLWQTWGATEEEALRALLPLAQGTLSAIQTAGVARGMPGPVSRGDLSSIEKHLSAIKPMGPEMLDFYRTLCAVTVPLARQAGGIDEARVAELIEDDKVRFSDHGGDDAVGGGKS